jgi:aryl-alcohol dehydrogenase-like predicted oxidoreductase
LARELGESAASLAHRYALSMPGVDTVVLGAKNRAELRDCLGAATKGPLPSEVTRQIDAGFVAARTTCWPGGCVPPSEQRILGTTPTTGVRIE